MRELRAARDEQLEELQKNRCWGCEKLAYHLGQRRLTKQLTYELDECHALLSSESNEKELDFAAKNKVLAAYNFIDEE